MSRPNPYNGAFAAWRQNAQTETPPPSPPPPPEPYSARFPQDALVGVTWGKWFWIGVVVFLVAEIVFFRFIQS